MNEIDPNWFFSATAQSFAAIVAIIGGFILSKFISMSVIKRNLEMNEKDSTQKLKNKELHYVPKIAAWRYVIEEKFFEHRKNLLNDIGNNFETELRKEINDIDRYSLYEAYELKYMNIILIIEKILYTSYEVGTYLEEKLGTHSEIKKYLNEHKNEFNDIFKKYKLEIKYRDKVFSYIINEKGKGKNFRPRYEEIENVNIESKLQHILRQRCSSLKPMNEIDVLNDFEAKMLELHEERENLIKEINQYKNENEAIKDEWENFRRLIKTPLIPLFIFGVVCPLIVLSLDSIFNNNLCNTFYIVAFSVTYLGIGYSLREIYIFLRDYLKF